MKKLFILLFGTLMILTLAYAAQAETAPAVEALTLEKCLELAAANSQSVKQAAKNVEIAQESVRQAQGGFGPSVNYELGSQYDSDPSRFYAGINTDSSGLTTEFMAIDPPHDGYGGSIKFTQPLYTGGKLTYGLEISKLQLKNAQESERKARQTLAYNVKDAFYKVWLAEQMVNVAKASYQNLGHHVEQVEHFYKVGTASKFDLLRAQVQHESLKPQVIKAENGLALSKLSLATLIGYPKDRQFAISYDSSQLKLPETIEFSNKWLDDAYQYRPEMNQIRLAAQLGEYKEKMTKAGFKPNLALTGSYDGGGADMNVFDWDKSWTITLGLQGLIWDSGITKSKIAAVKNEREVTALQESGLKDQIRLEMEQSQQGLIESLQTIRANQANTELAKESLRLTQARFDAGMATTMDIMDAQLALDQALNGYNQGIASYLTASAKMDLVSGK
jgi:outer membrane protein